MAIHKIDLYLSYSSPYYKRKFRCWDAVFALYGYNYQMRADKHGVYFWSDEPSKEEAFEMMHFFCSKF